MGIKILALRHEHAPVPDACRWCGYTYGQHDANETRWIDQTDPYRHPFTPPTDAQRAARSAARAGRKTCPPHICSPMCLIHPQETANAARTRL